LIGSFYVRGIRWPHYWSIIVCVPSKKSEHGVVLSICRQRKEIKIWCFHYCTKEILRYGSMPRLDWFVYWSIRFQYTFMVRVILLIKFPIKFSTKMFQKDDKSLK
jgi:hypothetical protein